MSVKKILAVMVAFMFMSSFAFAADKEYSLEVQKNSAENLIRSIDYINTPRANELRDTAIAYQKRIMDYNGLTMTNQFTSQYDYKTKMRPLKVANLNNDSAVGVAYGFGYFTIDYNYLEKLTSNNGKLDSFYSKLNLGQLLAHEMSHNISNHSFRSDKEKCEIEAETQGEKMMANLPEGGLGGYLVHMCSGGTDGEGGANIFRYYEQKAGNRISIKHEGLNQYSVYYKGSDGEEYKIRGGRSYGRDDETDYFAGQIAYCIAMGAFNVDNLEITRGTSLKGFPQDGVYLICRSPKLPNGYKVLTDVYLLYRELGHDENLLQSKFEATKQLFKKAPLKEIYEIATSYQGAEHSPDDKVKLIETIAIALDCNQR